MEKDEINKLIKLKHDLIRKQDKEGLNESEILQLQNIMLALRIEVENQLNKLEVNKMEVNKMEVNKMENITEVKKEKIKKQKLDIVNTNPFKEGTLKYNALKLIQEKNGNIDVQTLSNKSKLSLISSKNLLSKYLNQKKNEN